MQALTIVDLNVTDDFSGGMFLDTRLSDDSTSKIDAGSDPLLDQAGSTDDQLLLQNNPETGSETGRAWPSSISAESRYSLFSENKLLLDQD